MRRYFLMLIGLLVTNIAFSQSPYELYKYSYTSRNITTSRVAAMGGAFTSLGADPSSIIINPAGLGLYRSSEISITPSIIHTMVENRVNGSIEAPMTKTEITRFNLNNLNAIFNIINRSEGLVQGLTIGIGYNATSVNTVNYNSTAAMSEWSIANYYAAQLNNSGFSPADITIGDRDLNEVYGVDRSGATWGAIDAFNNGLFAYSDADGTYILDPNSLVEGDRFRASKNTQIKEKNEVYDFSFGLKISKYFNIGMSLGVANFRSEHLNDYLEYSSADNIGDYNTMFQYETRRSAGASFDFKVGVIVEPIEGLRIGIACHAPRVTKVYDEYFIDQEIDYTNDNTDWYTESAILASEYTMVSPAKMLLGSSYVIPGIGIISFDYERVWYNKMKLKNTGGAASFNDNVSNLYKPTDAFYVGAEFYLGANLFARGGFNYVTSPFKSEDLGVYDGSSMSISAGIGYKVRSFYADFAYIYNKVNELPYEYYNADFSPKATNRVFSNIFSLTLGWRF